MPYKLTIQRKLNGKSRNQNILQKSEVFGLSAKFPTKQCITCWVACFVQAPAPPHPFVQQNCVVCSISCWLKLSDHAALSPSACLSQIFGINYVRISHTTVSSLSSKT